MSSLRTQMRHLLTETRLLIAETLIHLAVKITPASHPDSDAIVDAAAHVFSRKPT